MAGTRGGNHSEITERSKIAEESFKKGYNCAQSVLLAYAPDLGLSAEDAARLGSSFGGGMGRMREVCGAVSAMFMILGLKEGYTSPADREAKTRQYKKVNELADLFRAENGSIVCADLLNAVRGSKDYVPEERTEVYYEKRPCAALVKCACEILDRQIF